MADHDHEQIPTDNVLQGGLRRLIRELRRLLAERAERQERIESDYARDSASTQEELERETKRIETESSRAIEQAESECKRRVEDVERSFAANERAVKDAYKLDRDALLEKADENLAAAKKQMEEAIWLSETVYEGGVEQPSERYEQAVRDIEHGVEIAEEFPESFERALKRARITGIVNDGEQDAGVAPPDPTEVDPRTAFDDAIEGARSALAAMQSDRIIRLFTGIQPIVLLLIGVGIGGGTAAVITQLEATGLILLSAVGGGAAILVLMALLYLIARLRAKSHWKECHRQLALIKALKKTVSGQSGR
jgi:hypothetical protein